MTAAHPHTQPRIVVCAGSSLHTQYAGLRASSNAERDSVHPAHTTKREQRSLQGRSSVPEYQIEMETVHKNARARPAQYSLDSTNWVRAVKHHPHFLHPGAGHWGVGSWAGMRVEASHKVTVKSLTSQTKITHTHISRTAGPGTAIRGVNPRSHGGGCAAKTASQKSTSYSCSRRTWRARSA